MDQAEINLRIKQGHDRRVAKDALYHVNGLIVFCKQFDEFKNQVLGLKVLEKEITCFALDKEDL